MRVTIRQIAEESGVSRGTVDRVLNNRGKVRPEVEERVRKVAEELGYKPNLLGRALIKMKENIKIGVILQDTGTPYLKTLSDGIKKAKGEVEDFGGTVIVKAVDYGNVEQTLAATFRKRCTEQRRKLEFLRRNISQIPTHCLQHCLDFCILGIRY